jgi:hypothetical protein
MHESWHCSAAYLYALHLDAGSLAWEYLRRNGAYRRAWERGPRNSTGGARHWGLAALENPNLDAREAQPLWQADLYPIVRLAPDNSDLSAHAAASEPFSLWRIRGRKSLAADGRCLRLTSRWGQKCLRASLDVALEEASALTFCIPATTDPRFVVAVMNTYHELVERRPRESPLPERPGVTDLLHPRALQALDGRAAGASQREIAAALFGRESVVDSWQPDSALRAQVRYLLRKAQELSLGGYRKLLARPAAPQERGGKRASV